VKEVDSPLVFQIKQLATHLTTLVFRSRCRTIRLTTSQSEIAIYDVGDQVSCTYVVDTVSCSFQVTGSVLQKEQRGERTTNWFESGKT